MHAYDCLDQVVFSAVIREYKDYDEGPSEEVVKIVGQVAGQGISDPREWLRDALVAMLELI